MAAPALDEISKQVSSTTGVSVKQETVQKPHYESKNVLNRENYAIRKLSTDLKRTGNPFSHDAPELMNTATKAVFEKKKMEQDVGRVYDLGRQLYSELIKKEKLIIIRE